MTELARAPDANTCSRRDISLPVAAARTALLIAFALLALPFGYAATLPMGSLGEIRDLAWQPSVMLPAAANALVILGSLRLQGRVDRRIAISFTRVIFIHAILAFIILLFRLPYSNQIIIMAMAVSFVLAPVCVWIASDETKVRVAAVGPWHPLMQRLDGRFDWIQEPRTNILEYDVILTPDIGSLPGAWPATLSSIMLMGRPVRHIAEFIEELEGRTCLDHFDPQHVQNGGITSYRVRKRIMDLVIVFLCLPVAIPILSVASIMALITMGRPILFIQDRVGLGGHVFRMYKLRTMRPAQAGEVAAATGASNLSRVTKLGRLLRRYRIDELPQLWNVLKGDMSIVGPRPEWRVLSDSYAAELPTYTYRYLVRPGITGWAQVRGGYASDLEETRAKVELDLFYIKNFSFALDLQILLRTIVTVCCGFGAR